VLGPARALRGPDTVVHAHIPVTALPLAMSRIPFLYTFHAPMWRELLDERQGTYRLPAALARPAVAGVRSAERLVLRRAAGTCVLSEFMRGEMSDLSPGAAARAQLLPGGIDVGRFRPEPGAARAGTRSPLLFTARRLTPRTGVDRLVSAMPEILHAHPETRLMVAGTGELDPELRRLAGRLGVAERVRFLGRVSED
jgi:glycosyltransferase involved in cell wall biosynthesis